jgi:RNA polymerase sigma-70 factor (ECF subfamily)
MNTEPTNDDLSEISTCWTDVRLAHRPETPEILQAAQERLLRRYEKAIKRYVRGAVDGNHNADDLFQKFAVRFIRGDFRRVDPGRGRFRDYLKSALFNLVQDHRKELRRFPCAIPANHCEPWVEDHESFADDTLFLKVWCDGLMERAWKSLEEFEVRSGRPLASILRYFLDHPETRSSDAAADFTRRCRRTITADWVRKTHMQARQILQEFLIHEVSQTLQTPSLANIEEELILLNLHHICSGAIRRRRGA